MGLTVGLFDFPAALRSGDWRYFAIISILGGFVAACTLLELRYRRNKPQAEGNCANCGYDLRATADRCPECGAVPSPGKEISKLNH
jgi:hypothetical protein